MRRYSLVISILLVVAGLVLALGILLSIGGRKMQLVLLGGQTGGVYSGIAQTIAQLVMADHPEFQIKVERSRGSEENRDRLEARTAHLALLQNDTQAGKHVRSVVPLYLEVLHFLARRDSPIHHVRDIRARRVAVGKRGSGTERLFAALIKHYGLSYEDFDPQYMLADEAVTALVAGQVEAMVFVAGLKSPACQRAVESGQVRFVALDQKQTTAGEVDGFRLDYPFVTSAVIPVRAYASAKLDSGGEPQRPLITIGVLSVLACRADTEASVMRAITRSIFQNRAKLIHEFPITADITEQFDRTDLQFPLHAGAESYYRRADPGFLVNYAEPMAFILSVAIAIMAGISGMKAWLHRRKKNRIDTYFVQLLKIVERLYAEQLETSQLTHMREELKQMHREAFEQLVKEKLNADESFRIFQTMILEYQRQVENRLAGFRV